MSQEEEMLEVSPKELEFAFAQAARFGAFIHFTYSQQDLCKKVFEEFGEKDVPAAIKFILKESPGFKKVDLIGFSQGTTATMFGLSA